MVVTVHLFIVISTGGDNLVAIDCSWIPSFLLAAIIEVNRGGGTPQASLRHLWIQFTAHFLLLPPSDCSRDRAGSSQTTFLPAWILLS